MYTGRGIIAPNKEFSPDLVDHRGSLPVEWWIMSKTEARNAKPIKNEGADDLLLKLLKIGPLQVHVIVYVIKYVNHSLKIPSLPDALLSKCTELYLHCDISTC